MPKIPSRSNKFVLKSHFKYGYRNKEDISNLPSEVLVVGSQNVLTNAAERVGIRQGYSLDGDAGNQSTYGIDSSYDFLTKTNGVQNLRKWGTAIECRYVNPNSLAVSWVDLDMTLDATKVCNFTNFWDFSTEVSMFCLFVNGDTNIYEWTGGVGSLDSVTANTIVLQGTLTTSQLGFYAQAGNSAKFKVLLGGIEYTYTGVASQTFTGVTPDPTAGGHSVGDAVIQSVATTAGSSVSSLPSGFVFDLISTLNNQIWYGQLDNSVVYVSNTNNYKDVTFTTTQRLPSEGALISLDAPPIGFSPQNQNMYLTAGRSEWWISQTLDNTVVISGVATQTQILYAVKLKLTFNQAAQSQGLIGNFKNSIAFVSNEPMINLLGLVENINQQPQITDISDPIKYDVDAYDFTGGHIIYDDDFIYVAIPTNSVVRMYNSPKKYWEAPQVMAISRFFHTNEGVLSGHSSLTNESYQLFTGTSDNGNPINAVAAFPYVSVEGGQPAQKKTFNELYTEGYLSTNTTLTTTINFDFGGSLSTYTGTIVGTDPQIMFNRITDGSIGQNTLGSQPIGTILNLPSGVDNPKFRKITTFPRQNCFEYQIVYSSNETDYQWEILRFGLAITGASALPVEITE